MRRGEVVLGRGYLYGREFVRDAYHVVGVSYVTGGFKPLRVRRVGQRGTLIWVPDRPQAKRRKRGAK